MEKTDHAVVMPLTVGWNDVGSWSALWEVGERDADGNIDRGDVISVDTRDSYMDAATRLVATVGVEDLVVVETADAVLVASKDRVQEVKAVVDQLKASQRPEGRLTARFTGPGAATTPSISTDVSRSSASWSSPAPHVLADAPPPRRALGGGQRHRPRHRGDEVFLLTENQSTYIPVGVQHRLKTPARFRWRSLKCSRAAIWARTILCALRMCMAGKMRDQKMMTV